MGGRARPERPGEAVLALGCEGHAGLPQGFGLLGHRRALTGTGRRCIRVKALLDISAAGWPQALDQTSQLVRRRRDGLWGAKARFHPPHEGPQGTRRVGQQAGGEAQGDRDARRPGAHPPR
jgi:hypothetical protein